MAKKRCIKALFLFPYPHSTAASQRFRFEQYLPLLKEANISYTLAPFLDEKTWRILYKKGYLFSKVMGIGKGFFYRIALLSSVPAYDVVFIHREASPIGPPVFEWMIAKIFRKKIIFDFDDAIWLPNTSEHNRIAAFVKWHAKTASICRWAYKISAGNPYLAAYARHFNTKVIINPTTIDTLHLHNQIKNQLTNEFVIGWTGTHSTIQYLNEVIPLLQELENDYRFTFLVISDKAPLFILKSLLFVPWNKATEREDLLKMNIGLMPLTDDRWARGKCGFKALQYMALGIPALVSPVGVNSEIVENGKNGFICSTPEDWKQSILQLLENADLRVKMGLNARKKIEDHYSVQANRLTFLNLFLSA